MDPVSEAAQILTRLFEALARRSGKTLNERSRADIRRACELLASAGEELDDLLDELPPPAPRPAPEHRPAREYATVTLPEVERWREQRDRQ
jgi:hypothetical protein